MFLVALARAYWLDGVANVASIGHRRYVCRPYISVIFAGPEELGPFFVRVAVIICNPVHRRAPQRLSSMTVIPEASKSRWYPLETGACLCP